MPVRLPAGEQLAALVLTAEDTVLTQANVPEMHQLAVAEAACIEADAARCLPRSGQKFTV